jgi:hypothetical protein
LIFDAANVKIIDETNMPLSVESKMEAHKGDKLESWKFAD